jgi:hypothetical protein
MLNTCQQAKNEEAPLRPPPARKRRDQSSYMMLANSSTSNGWVLGIGEDTQV